MNDVWGMDGAEGPLLVELVREGISRNQFVYLTIISTSMLPLLRPGDQVGVRAVTTQQLASGDIVVFATGGTLMTHRYYGAFQPEGNWECLSRGDNVLHFDNGWKQQQLVGKVVARRRQSHILSLEKGSGRRLNQHLATCARLQARIFNGARADAHGPAVPIARLKRSQPRNIRYLRARLAWFAMRCWMSLITFLVSGFSALITRSASTPYLETTHENIL